MNYSIKNCATLIEDGLIQDLERAAEKNPLLFEGSEIVLMADAHKGAGVPIGFTQKVKYNEEYQDYLVAPSFVSSDIGCGVSGVLFEGRLEEDSLVEIREEILKKVPLSGPGYSLGGGNHYIEIGVSGNQTLVSVHSGSRGVGGRIFKKHNNGNDFKEILKQERLSMIQQMKAEGRQSEIESTLKTLFQGKEHDIPMVRGIQSGYFKDVRAAVSHASDNRAFILKIIVDILNGKGLKKIKSFNTKHNYIEMTDDAVYIRKGAIAAYEGDEVLIPINMRDGVLIAKVGDTSAINNSLCHGAGRVLSRTAAKAGLSSEEFKEQMEGIVCGQDFSQLLDEAPGAYKPLEVLLGDVRQYLQNYTQFKTILNVKGE